MKRDGFSQEQKALYGDAVLKLSIASTVDKTKSHCIKSLTAEKDLDVAAIVLVDTFQKEDAFHDSIDGSKERVNFLRASMKAVACFNQVLGCFDDDDDATKARNKTPPLGVMACIPVLSKSQEEVEVFCTLQACLEYGFPFSGATEMNLSVPGDGFVELHKLKKRTVHGLTKRPYMYIAYLGGNSTHKGRGYGQTLLNHVIEVSEHQGLPLVVETTTKSNIAEYEKYGFKVVDSLADDPEWVLMVRSNGQELYV